MIVSFTLQKMQEMEEKCHTIQACVQFIKQIPRLEIQNSLSHTEEVLILQFLSSDEGSEEKLLLLYFCGEFLNQKPKVKDIFIKVCVLYFLKFCDSSIKAKNHSPLSAYLSDRILSQAISLRHVFDKPEMRFSLYTMKANLVSYLIFLTPSEQRNRLHEYYENIYNLSSNLSKEVQAQAAHNYGLILFDIYFVNPSYINYPDKGIELFEQAIKLRTKNNPSEQQIREEVLSRTSYSKNLRKLRLVENAKTVLSGLLEKIESFKKVYSTSESFYEDYLECLNNTFNLHEDLKLHGLENNYSHYLEKMNSFIRKLVQDQTKFESDSLLLFITNAYLRNLILIDHQETLFQKMISNDFWTAKKIVDNTNITEFGQEFANPNLARYGIFLKIVKLIYEFWKNERHNADILKVLIPMTCGLHSEYPELFYSTGEEIQLIGAYGISLLKNEKNDEGIYYCIYFLTFYPIADRNRGSFVPFYQVIINELSKVFEQYNKESELANTLYCINKLPWYFQQFRTIKSPEYKFLLEKLLQLEIRCDGFTDMNLVCNILSAWDNLTLDMGAVAKRIANFYRPPHPIHRWSFIINQIILFSKMRTELGAESNYQEYELALIKEWQKNCETPVNHFVYGQDFISNLLQEDMNLGSLFQLETDCFHELMCDEEIRAKGDFRFFNDSPFPNMQKISQIESLKEILSQKRILCLNSFLNDRDLKLLSTLIFEKDGELFASNHISNITKEEMIQFHHIVWELKITKKDDVFIDHYKNLFANISNKNDKSLIWIGVDLLKFFPIHILPTTEDKTWLDIWDTIEFCPSLREVYLPYKDEVYYIKPFSKEKKIVPIYRIIGEKDSGRFAPSLGNNVFRQLAKIENISLSNAQPIDSGHTEMGCMPEVLSYYGHICYGHPLNPEVGFLTNGKVSNLNLTIAHTEELTALKRIELWGCESAKMAPYQSRELTSYEHFAERFLQIGIEQIIATLNYIPDLTAALICEHFTLLEKRTTTKNGALLLKKAVLSYRNLISSLKERVKPLFCEWLSNHQGVPSQRIDGLQHKYLRGIITKIINDIRSEFYKQLDFEFSAFTEKEIDQSLLRDGELCFLGKNKKKKNVRFDNPHKYADQIMDQIFTPLESKSAWGAIIFINTCIR